MKSIVYKKIIKYIISSF